MNVQGCHPCVQATYICDALTCAVYKHTHVQSVWTRMWVLGCVSVSIGACAVCVCDLCLGVYLCECTACMWNWHVFLHVWGLCLHVCTCVCNPCVYTCVWLCVCAVCMYVCM